MVSEILGDATVTAPLIKVAGLHSKVSSSSSRETRAGLGGTSTSSRHPPPSSNTYLYTFEYSSKKGDYPSLEECVHGQELSYIFGSPLVPGMELGYFASDHTDEETILSTRIMSYWTNFAKFG